MRHNCNNWKPRNVSCLGADLSFVTLMTLHRRKNTDAKATTVPNWVVVILIGVVCGGGCTSRREVPAEIVGIVCTAPGINRSFILHQNHLGEGYTSIEDATVFLAQNDAPEDPLKGFEVKTAKDGSYRIKLEDVPVSTSSHRAYLLVIKKDGYESFSVSMGLGVLSPYLNNTVVLRSLGKE